jgi:hypothetical protein
VTRFIAHVIFPCIYVCLYVCYVYMCMYVCLCMHVCACVCGRVWMRAPPVQTDNCLRATTPSFKIWAIAPFINGQPQSGLGIMQDWINGKQQFRTMWYAIDDRDPHLCKIVWDDGEVYVGPLKQGLPHGRGKCTFDFKTQEYYDGDLNEGQRHGQGTYVWANQDRYTGEWSHDRRHGYGTKTCVNTDKRGAVKEYSGEWVIDQYHGFGTLTLFKATSIDKGCVVVACVCVCVWCLLCLLCLVFENLPS